jgi:hypothetical protein
MRKLFKEKWFKYKVKTARRRAATAARKQKSFLI